MLFRRMLVILMSLLLLLSLVPPQVTVAEARTGGSEAERALDRVNHYRAQIGLPPVRLNTSLNQAAAAHARYLAETQAPMELSAHYEEDRTHPAFVGFGPGDRAARFGYTDVVYEIIAKSSGPEDAVDQWMATLYHRMPLVDPRVDEIGYGSAGGYSALLAGTRTVPSKIGGRELELIPAPPGSEGKWPYPGQTGVSPSWHGREAPDPLFGRQVSPPVGPPISLAFWSEKRIVYLGSATLTDPDGKRVRAIARSRFTIDRPDGGDDGYLPYYIVALIPIQPLKPFTTYQVTFSGRFGEKEPWTRSWSFTTGASPDGEVPQTLPGEPLWDISDDPHEPAIRSAVAGGLIPPKPDGSFVPYEQFTRSEFFRALFRAWNLAPRPLGNVYINDWPVVYNHSITKDGILGALLESGFIRLDDYRNPGAGVSIGPGMGTTRLEASRALIRALGWEARAKDRQLSVVDGVATVAGYRFGDAVDWPEPGYLITALEAGILPVPPDPNGDGIRELYPNGWITRSEAAAMFARALALRPSPPSPGEAPADREEPAHDGQTKDDPVLPGVPQNDPSCAAATGPQVRRVIHGVTITADRAVDLPDGRTEYCGNLAINGYLKLHGRLLSDADGRKIRGNGNAYMHTQIPLLGGHTIGLFSGPFVIDPRAGEIELLGRYSQMRVGGLPFTFERVSLEEEGVAITGGSLGLPVSLGGVMAPVKRLTVTPQGIEGQVRLPTIGFGPKRNGNSLLSLEDVFIEYSATKDLWSGEAVLKVGDTFGLQGAFGIAEGKVNRLGGGLKGLRIPLTPAVTATRVYFEVSGMQVPPLIVLLDADLTMGPVINTIPVLQASGAHLEVNMAGEIKGGGTMLLFEQFPVAQGELRVALPGWGPSGIGVTVSGDVNLLDVLLGHVYFHMDRTAFYGEGSGRLQVPRAIPLFGGHQFSNVSIYVDTEGAFGAFALGNLEGNCYVTWDRQYDCSRGLKRVYRTTYRVPSLAAAGPVAGAVPVQSLTIGSDEEQVIVRMTWTKGDADLLLTAPDGTQIGPKDAPLTSPFANYVKNAEAREAFYILTRPQAGVWNLAVANGAPAETYEIELYRVNRPSLALTLPDADREVGGPVEITWETDAPVGSTLNLFYDRVDQPGLSAPIALGLDAGTRRYTWQTDQVPDGIYKIRAILAPEGNAPVRAEAPGLITVRNPRTPAAPTGLRASGRNGTVELSWERPNQDEVTGYRVHLLGEEGRTLTLGDVSQFAWTGLEPERTYQFAVSAFTHDGLESQRSAPVELYLKRPVPPALEIDWPDGPLTRQKDLLLKGSAEAGATVTILLNGKPLAEGLQGKVALTVPLTEGENLVEVIARKPDGDSATVSRVYRRDSIPPHLTVDQLLAEVEVAEPGLVITGMTEPGVRLTLNGRPVFVRPDGGYKALLPLNTEAYEVRLVATDEAGNQSQFSGIARTTATCGRRFQDVSADQYGCEAIEQLASLGVIGGYPDGRFQPARRVSRAEFAKMLVAALSREPDASTPLAFTDTAGHWAQLQGYLQTAVAINAISGFPDGSFQPDQVITRAQIVKIVAAAAGLAPNGLPPYQDIRGDEWYSGWVASAVQHRLIGREAAEPLWPGKRFDGDRPVTRAEAAMILVNLLRFRP